MILCPYHPRMVWLPLFTYIWLIFLVNVGKYTSPMDGMGCILQNTRGNHKSRKSQAVICGIYHYCDQHRIGTDLAGPSCSEPSYRILE